VGAGGVVTVGAGAVMVRLTGTGGTLMVMGWVAAGACVGFGSPTSTTQVSCSAVQMQLLGQADAMAEVANTKNIENTANIEIRTVVSLFILYPFRFFELKPVFRFGHRYFPHSFFAFQRAISHHR